MKKPGAYTIITGFAESLAAIETIYCLHDAGMNIFSFTRKNTKPALKRFKGINVFDITAPEISLDTSCSDLIQSAKDINADLIMPLDDISLWLCNRIRDAIPAVFVGPDISSFDIAFNKKKQLYEAKRAGFTIPETVYINNVNDLDAINVFPSIIKPGMAVYCRENRLIKGKAFMAIEPSDIPSIKKSFPPYMEYILQPIVRGTGEGLFGYSDGKEIHNISAHRRLRMMNPIGSGASACCSIPPRGDIIDHARKFIEGSGFRGIFMIETLRDLEDRNYFIELNGRAWGSMALALRRGFLYPAWAVEGALDVRHRPEKIHNEGKIVLRHLGREIIHLMMVLRGSRYKKYFLWPSRLRTLIDLFSFGKNEYFYNYRKGRSDVFVLDVINTIKQQLFKK